MTMSKTLLKKMAGEVSQPILGGLLADYAQQVIEAEDVTEELAAAIEILSAELKSRVTGASNSQRTRRSRAKKTEEATEESPKSTTQNTPAPPRNINASIGGITHE
ncbi:hypothetical protein [Paenibacillus sp. PDC88]|uniref:hypothetical protein n=1 Tax=Paenibacillus sp. PDC88 TaxID=1884375 RepID=UPI00089D692A|nr:hypothetical protein [Paenibacillus sp. PDC88]SDW21726.1 hypothetical protein SAMN05518848_101685 [Paenibacillus sp. PDC88]